MSDYDLDQARRIVVKIGSSLLIDADTGILDRAWLDALVGELTQRVERGQDVIVVSSGAIGLGRSYLDFAPGPRRLDELQAAAAAGQIILARAYQELFDSRDRRVAQVLLTLEDTEDRRRYLNARSTLETLLRVGAVPIINENDTVATAEIRYGDNDRLAARVAQMISADCLVLLSDVQGLYSADPAKQLDAALIPRVDDITPEIEKLAGLSSTEFGSGGMVTKVAAARIATSAGCATAIASGRRLRPLGAIVDGKPCTWFMPGDSPRAARKRWIAGSLTPHGSLKIDAGAERALRDGGSLLPVGVIGVYGDFERGDAVSVHNMDGQDIARGLATYSSEDARRIIGRRSEDIGQLLGYPGRDELVHRDNLVLLDR